MSIFLSNDLHVSNIPDFTYYQFPPLNMFQSHQPWKDFSTHSLLPQGFCTCLFLEYGLFFPRFLYHWSHSSLRFQFKLYFLRKACSPILRELLLIPSLHYVAMHRFFNRTYQKLKYCPFIYLFGYFLSAFDRMQALWEHKSCLFSSPNSQCWNNACHGVSTQKSFVQ